MLHCRRVIVALLAGVVTTPSAWAMRPAKPSQAGPAEAAADGAAQRRAGAISAVVPERARAAWRRFLDTSDGRWRASWDGITAVPSRIVGTGLAAPGSVASPDRAVEHARAFLRANIDLLAPGADPDDFVVVSNDVDGGLRTVGMFQYYDGLRVIGGQVSFRFKNDRLFVIASEAFPQVRVEVPKVAVAPSVDALQVAAREWVRAELDAGEADVSVAGVGAAAILPVITVDGGVEYRRVVEVSVDSSAPRGAWAVYLAADSGAPVARRQRLRFANAAVRMEVPVRYPGAYEVYPAAGAYVRVPSEDGAEPVLLQTDPAGVMSWDGDEAIEVSIESVSDQVQVFDRRGLRASVSRRLQPDGVTVWSGAGDPELDAYLATFVHAGIAKEFARTLAPNLSFLNQPLRAKVNIDSTCNAFSDGETINFFQGSEVCENTGRLADVIYHEFGHVLHVQSLVAGAGSFDSALSEGLADYLAATMTGDPGVGRGFFLDDEPLRHIDPEDREYVWPEDIGEIHDTGRIIAGALWDLRKRLIARYGEAEGVAQADRLFLAVVRRAANIPSAYVEVLAADDTDGDLGNGTPNGCDIADVFAAHGLRSFTLSMSRLAAEAVSPEGHPVELEIASLTGGCPGDEAVRVNLHWDRRDGSAGGTLALVRGGDTFSGVIPAQPEGTTVAYSVEVTFDDGQVRSFPENPAEPALSFFVGDVVPLYCIDFERDPFLEGWRDGPNGSYTVRNANDWQWGMPISTAGGDPARAFSGRRVLGNDLGGSAGNRGDGSYEPRKITYAISPVVPVGVYTDVRLQYWRWLNVEDGHFDQASIYANEELVWRNLDSRQGLDSTLHHRDAEWVFHDVPLGNLVGDGGVEVMFEIRSNRGFELGGWTIDDLCVVARRSSVCGDGVVSGAEACDEGAANSDVRADTCRRSCLAPTCGDGVVDSGEACDDGNEVDGDACSNACVVAAGGGCDAGPGSGGPAGALLLGLGVLAWLRRRRPHIG
ncbi:DUF4215 domain-containing protein [Haliangium sp.]|uniref:DUF4215 domain-containing protein n=1 Tax=Haliangium sp. TaxID=2663208 RepID=UPI003D10B2FE